MIPYYHACRLFATVLAETCFKIGVRREGAGKGYVEIPMDMLQGRYTILITLEAPEPQGRNGTWDDVFGSEVIDAVDTVQSVDVA